MAKAYQERLIALIKDTVTLLCKNGLEYNQEFCVEGLLGVTLDKDEVFLIPIRELVNDKGVGTTDTTTDDVPLDVSQTDDMSSAMSPKRERKKKRRHAESTLTQDESDAGYGDAADWDSKNERGTTENQDHDTNDNTNGGDQPTAAKRRSRDDIKTDLSKVKAEDIVVIKEEVDDDEFVTAFQDSSMDSGSLNRTAEQTDSTMAYYSQPGPSQGGTGMPFSMDQLTEGSALSANMASLPPGSEGDTSWLQQSQASIQNPSGDWQGQKHQAGQAKCILCNQGFNRIYALYRHIESVHQRVRFRCSICGSEYSRQDSLKRHQSHSHGENASLCVADSSLCAVESGNVS